MYWGIQQDGVLFGTLHRPLEKFASNGKEKQHPFADRPKITDPGQRLGLKFTQIDPFGFFDSIYYFKVRNSISKATAKTFLSKTLPLK